jgi:hypothetical protein
VRALERTRSGFTARSESSHRPLALREPSPRHEKMEERLEAPSVVSIPPPASAGARSVSALVHPTPRGVGQRHSPCSPFDVQARRLRTGSLGADRHVSASATVAPRLSTRDPAAPRCSSSFPDVLLPSASADRGSLRGARSSCLRRALRRDAEHELDAFDRLLLPDTSTTTSTRARCVPSISPRLSPRPSVRPCEPDGGDWGTKRFTTPDPLRRVTRVSRGVFFRALLVSPCL